MNNGREGGNTTRIESTHLVILQELVDFLQGRGWDVLHVGIERYDSGQDPFTAEEPWKQKTFKWQVSLSTAPRDQETIPVPAREGPATA